MFRARGLRRPRLGRRGVLAAAAVAAALGAVWALAANVGGAASAVRIAGLALVAALVGLVTERREAQGRQTARWLSVSGDLVCSMSVDGRFAELNEGWTQLLGHPREELLGRPFVELVHGDDREASEAAAAQLGEPDVPVSFESRMRAADGSWRWLEWTARSDGELVYAVARDVTERKRYEEEREELLARATRLAQTDDLTGVFNRAAWHARLKHEVMRAERSGAPLGLVLIDVDRFHEFNAEHGHAAGDRILKACAQGLSGAIRGTDCLGRVGGDDFALLLPDCDVAAASDVLARLRDATPDGVTCAMGMAQWEPPERPERLMMRADRALYAAKRQGRDRIASVR